MASVISDVITERYEQDEKWGTQSHPPEIWLAILTEEVGEYAETVLKLRWPHADDPDVDPSADTSHVVPELRKELVQVAAVAVAAIECLDR